ncbi:MAG: acetyl-CoA carboxylase biotin carboxyl carrier protein [Thermomicrobiales bacterium]|nr:acetyl-CoA carboxylase biotin carboxyl carrier protein [Thermomicrobiales bacterium]MCO5219516.1 acetyl-CoA carboxylase biotin carboxyl carrier protein [Thermomicrobiales bacterium]MCO5228646.1 acetyl-CoA carboxylase biotin carboxyl carrier protein [Thermomicrobiales bacterium]
MSDHENEMQSPDIVEAVRSLIEMMNDGGIGELNLKTDGFKIRLRSEAVAIAANTPSVSMAASMPQFAGYAPPAVAEAVAISATSEAANDATPVKEGHIVTSPMIGTFYSASAPGEPAFVQIGDEVETGQVIGIIEAMKIMNEITADRGGVVVEVLVENAEAVEYGTPLVRISNSARLD